MKKILFLVLVSLVWTVALMAEPVTPSQAKKYSMTTRMFLQELKDGGFDPVKQETRRKARRAALGSNVPKDILEPQRRSKNDGRFYVAPDTINGVAYVLAFITLEDNRDTSELETLGVRVRCKFDEGIITSEIPVEKILDVAALSNVKRISVAQMMETCSNIARKHTNIDDILIHSEDALRAGIDKRYDGSGVLLGIIDKGIDFQHIAFKDVNGNSRIVRGWDGATNTDFTPEDLANHLTDNYMDDHGTHTASIAGGSSVIINGSSVTVTNDHASATYGGMAPGTSLYLCGLNELYDVVEAECIKKICNYGDEHGMPVVISNSYGSQIGAHDGETEKNELQIICSQLFNDSMPNHICLFSTGNYADVSRNNEGGGNHILAHVTQSNPMGTILRSCSKRDKSIQDGYYIDPGYVYEGFLVDIWTRTPFSDGFNLTIYILDSSNGKIKASIPVENWDDAIDVSDYYDGTLRVQYQDYGDKFRFALRAGEKENRLISKDDEIKWIWESTYVSKYTLAFEISPKGESSVDVDLWADDCYFTNHLITDGHQWIAGNNRMSITNQATMPDIISVGAYVSRNVVADYNNKSHQVGYTMGEIGPFSSYATEYVSPTGKSYPWITAPGATVISAVNHNNIQGELSFLNGNSVSNGMYLVNNNTTYPYGNMEGTSMACPVVAGTVALWLQAANEKGLQLTTSDVKQIMAETAIKDGFVTGANSTHFGNGKIDAMAGLIKVLEKADASINGLSVTNFDLIDGNLDKGLFNGTILSGSLDIKNNDAEAIEEEVIIGLEDVESPLASKTKSISVSINPNCVEGYDIRFYNLTANHRYVITASHVTGEEFYRSPVLLCKAGYEIENYPSMYSDYQVVNEPYVKTNMAAFKTNVRVAGDRIWNAINKYQSHGIVAKKADLVGHSMGGVLSRLHVQYAIGGTENVHKVITVNTPHSGSPLGDIAGPLVSGVDNDLNGEIDKINNLKNFDSIIDEFFGWDSRVKEVDNIDLQAVSDLGVNSDATDNYLNKNSALDKMNNIPVHAIVTDVTGLSASDIEYLSGEDEMWLGLVRIAEKLGLKYMWEDDTDLIVSVQSQKGGLESPFFSTIHDQWHCGSTRNENVQKRLIELLNAPVHAKEEKDQVFCFMGFRPDDISLKDYLTKQSDFASTKRRVSAVGVEPTLTASVNDNMLTASMAGAEGYDYQLMLIQFGKEAYSMVSGSLIECEVPASFYGDATVYGIVRMEDEGILWSKTQINIPTPRASRASISASALSIYYDEAQPVSLTCTWSDGSETHVLPDVISFTDNLARYENGYVTGLHVGSGTATFSYEGLTCEAPFTVYNFEKSDDEEGSESVCSTITLKLSQTMTMTRQAFRGTLTMFNGNEAMSMKDVKLALKITNVATGEVATAHEFQINPESIDGFTGEVDLSSGWTLAGNATGKAIVLFIPTKYAAPTEPVEWSFGGTLSYLDPFTGLVVTRDLYPVTLTVKPSPELDLDYFLQRDVFGDDPLTEEVEPMQPAEFALLINNKGYGDATNVRMVTQQPQIIDNEKGLLIDFELLSSQVNGSDKTLAFGQSIANDFGTIDAQSQAYAQWWLQSSLLGHFTEYSVKANHVTSYGNEDLSLLDQVNIHELIHGFTPTMGGRGFLVNDIVDAADMPDGIYFTDATQEIVSIATNATLTKQGDDYLLTVMPIQTGWNYGSLIDPTDGKKEITSIIRQSDGVEIPLDNIWRTDRTLRDGKDPIAENRLHFVGNILSDSESYLLSFTPREEVSNVVTGHVAAQTENGQPVVGATVTLCSGDVVYTTTTDGAGYFTLKVDETSLDYVMTCTAEGFIDGAEKEVRFLGDTVKCNYTLMPGATIKIPASGICTYSSVVGLDFSQATLPVKAYYGKRYDTERVIIDELTTAAANEGLVLMGQPNSRVDVPEAVNVAPLAENVLYGTAFAPYTVTSDDVYVLANKTGKPKFHQAAQGLVIPKNKAYLLLFIGESGSKGIDVIFDEATLIDMIRSAENRENHYGIDGIRIGETVKGIHVVKGKKLIVK